MKRVNLFGKVCDGPGRIGQFFTFLCWMHSFICVLNEWTILIRVWNEQFLFVYRNEQF